MWCLTRTGGRAWIGLWRRARTMRWWCQWLGPSPTRPPGQQASAPLREEGELGLVSSRIGSKAQLAGLRTPKGLHSNDTAKTVVTNRFHYEEVEPNVTELDQLGVLMEGGRIRPVVHKTWPLEKAAEALDELRRGGHVGKMVLSLVQQ